HHLQRRDRRRRQAGRPHGARDDRHLPRAVRGRRRGHLRQARRARRRDQDRRGQERDRHPAVPRLRRRQGRPPPAHLPRRGRQRLAAARARPPRGVAGAGVPPPHRQRGEEGRVMTAIWTIAKREFGAYFKSPIAYIVLIVFAGLASFLFSLSFFLYGNA